jgi:hypothetical protein
MPSKRLLYDFDVGQVRTMADFQREMGRHFKMDVDHAKIWQSISHGLVYLPTACTFRFQGWSEFERHMPHYARRLRQMIQSYQRVMSEETYTIEYA